MKEINDKADPLFIFFEELLGSEKEKNIIRMIIDGCNEEHIIEKLINYTEEKQEE